MRVTLVVLALLLAPCGSAGGASGPDRALAGTRCLTCGRVATLPADGRGTATVLAQGWQEYSPREREKAIKNYERYRDTPPQRRREIEREYQRWQQMPEDKQQRIRENYERYLSLPREERREFNQKFQRWRGEREPKGER